MKKILIISLCILSLLGVTACTKKNEEPKETEQEKLERVLKEKSYFVMDVRSKEEYQKGHVKYAVNIPYENISESLDLTRDLTILVYCQSGKRSKLATEKLKELGYDAIDIGAYDDVTLEKVVPKNG